MAERYTKLYTLEKNLYTAGSPVLISAAVLLQDSFTMNLLAQLKLKNVSSSIIKAVKVSIYMLDTTGARLGSAVDYQYLDLNAARDDEFGQKSAIVLSDRNVRSYQVEVREAVFADGSIWSSAADAQWTPLQPQNTLEEALGSSELATQYQVRYGSDCKYRAFADGGLWFCACGAVNLEKENNCHKCRRVFTAMRDVNLASLKLECTERLKAEAEQHSQDSSTAEVKKKKRLKLTLIIIPALIAAIVLGLGISTVVVKSRAYSSAQALLAGRQYEQAAAAFTELGNYKDSAEQAEKNVPYQKALYVMELAKADDSEGLAFVGLGKSAMADGKGAAVLLYEAAIEQFTALDGYKDSAANIELCRAAIEQYNNSNLQSDYDEALALMKKGRYLEARDAFKALGSFSDSADMAKEAIYQKAAALFGFMEKYDVRQIYASISLTTGVDSIFSVPKDTALSLGGNFISDLRAICGSDGADIRLADTPDEGLLPFTDCVSALFTSLGKYSDSSSYVEKVKQAADYTREFFELCAAGDIYGAYDWLSAYDGDFENRDYYMELLDMYKPFCDAWQLYMGDSTLISITAGVSQPCGYFSSCVIISDDTATLRFTVSDGVDYTLDFTSPLGSRDFVNSNDGAYTYYVAITAVDHMAYMKYDGGGNLRSSCEYERAQ